MQSVPHRPPPLRCIVFHSIHLPHLHCLPSDSYWASVCLATLPDMPCLICGFCPSDQRFAIRLPPDSTSRWTPLSLAIHFPLSGFVRDFHPLDYAHAGRTKIAEREEIPLSLQNAINQLMDLRSLKGLNPHREWFHCKLSDT